MWTLAWEDTVLAVTCKRCRMVGVRKEMLVGDSGGEGEDSGSSLQIKLSHTTRAATLSSLLGIPWCQRAQAIQMISSNSPTYMSPQLTLLCTLVMVAKKAWLVAGSSVKGMAACVLPSGVQMEGPGHETACVGGAMFSWSESLSSQGVGLLGCGKSVSLMQTKVMGVLFCMCS